MIKIYNLTLLVLFLIICSKIQIQASSFEFVFKDEIVSGGLNDEIRAKAEIKNVTANVINVKSKLEILSLTNGHTIVFCWDICYPPVDYDMISEGYLTLMPLGTSGENFHADIFADGISGESKARFTFFNMDKPDDSISFTITFLVGTTGVEKTISDITFSLSEPNPNPASRSALINYNINNNFSEARIRFFDTKGIEIFNQQLNQAQGSLNIEHLKLSQGVYFYHLEVDGLISNTKKLIITR